jgi:hypothetical protein
VEYVVCARVVGVFVDLVLEHPGSRGNERRDDGGILGAMHVSEEILIRDDSRSTRLPAPRLERQPADSLIAWFALPMRS